VELAIPRAMAAVLDALTSYVTELIVDMVKEEVDTLLGISGEINKLGRNVCNVEAYVADAERRCIDDPRVQGWVNRLKGAMYDATDILELCQLDAEKRRHSRMGTCMEEKVPGWLMPLLYCLCNPTFAYHMGKRIKELNERLDEIRKDMVDFKFVKLDQYQLRIAPRDVTLPSRTTTSQIDMSAIVGDAIERDTNALVQVLLANEPAIKVVSITGTGGVGKTTLAKKIFNDRAIQVEFKSKVWLSITESYNTEKLLSSAITQVGEGREVHGDREVLTQALTKTLSSGKFLMVLDDVWSAGLWTDVLESPVIIACRNQPGSRVIITTRDEDLVKKMGATDSQLHHVKPLCDEDAWSLLKKQLPPQVPIGLPLYIVVVFSRT